MGIDMYLGEVESQTTSVETFCQLTIEGLEDVIRAIDAFNMEPSLQGKTYASAKRYFMETYRVLAEGMILLCQDLQEPNKQLTTNFQAEVANTDVIEEELVQQIEEMERLQAGLKDMLDQLPLLKPMDDIYTMCKKKLVTKLENLRLFHQTSATYFDPVIQQAKNLQVGLIEVLQHTSFNASSGTFSTMGMNMSWVASIEKAWTADQKKKQEAAEEALIKEYEENMPLPYIPKGSYAGFVVKDGKLDTEATLKRVDEQVELNKETNAKWLAIFDFVTPVIDAVRAVFGVEPTTGKKVSTGERLLAAGFIIIPFVKVTKIEKFAKLARDNKAFKFTYEGYDDVFQLSKTEHVGKLKGKSVKLDGVMEKTIIYTKRSSSEAKILRKKFDSSVRKTYLKNIVMDESAIKEFKAAGLSEKQIQDMKKGIQPKEYQVHHKLPLDDSGTNDYSNLMLIKTDPYHKVITNTQIEFSKKMSPGESVKVKFPVPEGNIYPK
ncbi:Bacillus transposase protein [Listeria ivanovii subsp. londoniensis]|uniref:DNase/tRNase domain of colicin-like bacteriocin n=1 Tax=Listeria ivanovii TaxID=1638 RepID=A0AAX2DTR4_LISIV|nr:pre-toxin TG domain-containing protein [Listeria ivanovii]EFR96331.1 HNH endonuclease domain protein [Listeria ivanovii FSL F6-596]SDX46663.1 DNase/tRNase domain of colicin-like bacteriocin [Listeria ivanovii]VEH47218.1 Bacillus transposase protein [Listeria ivanovii subsp. londoniensis]